MITELEFQLALHPQYKAKQFRMQGGNCLALPQKRCCFFPQIGYTAVGIVFLGIIEAPYGARNFSRCAHPGS